jgi:hypothetical protein
VHNFVSSIFDYDLHAKRVDSLSDPTVGALQGARLAVGALGRALAVAKELDVKDWRNEHEDARAGHEGPARGGRRRVRAREGHGRAVVPRDEP